MFKMHLLLIAYLTILVVNCESPEKDQEFTRLKRQNYDVNVFSIQKEEPQIFINQSDDQVIKATYGQTIVLPCIVYRQTNQDLSNVHVVWSKLYHYQRPSTLSIGKTLLKQDMRYILKNTNEVPRVARQPNRQQRYDGPIEYAKENWQFEIRKLNYEDAGKYQCSLSLAKPIAKNITLEVRPDLTIEPKEATFGTSSKIQITCQVTLRHTSPRLKYARKHLRQPHRPYMAWYKDTPQGYKEHINAAHNETGIKKHEIHTERKGLVFRSHLTIHDANPEDSGRYRCIFEHFHQSATIRVSNGQYSHKNLQGSMEPNSSNPSTNSKRISFTVFILFIFKVFFEQS